MDRWDNRRMSKLVRVACGAIAMAAFAVQPAGAYDDTVIKNCTGDYLAFCTQHDPDSSATRVCMENHRAQLSSPCKRALILAGEVPRKYIVKKVNARQ